jgi:hypothetical protein
LDCSVIGTIINCKERFDRAEEEQVAFVLFNYVIRLLFRRTAVSSGQATDTKSKGIAADASVCMSSAAIRSTDSGKSELEPVVCRFELVPRSDYYGPASFIDGNPCRLT